MNNILIIYFSGSGATKTIAQKIKHILKNKSSLQLCNVDLYSVEKAIGLDINKYDALIIGTPVYHCSPCRMIMKYFDNIPIVKKTKPTFIFNTRGMYSCNTNRILAKTIAQKNLIVIKDKSYKSPASDAALILPFVKRFFKFDKNIDNILYKDCNDFIKRLKKKNHKGYIPRFRFYSILNAPNKFIGSMKKFKIYLNKKSCTKCKKCFNNCPHKVITLDDKGFPKINIAGCENCYRCIYHCPKKALSLNKKKAPS